MGKCLYQLLLACLFTNKTMKKSDRQVRIGMKLMMNTWSNISCTVSTWLTEMCQISILCPVHIYHYRHSTHSDLLIWETMYLLGYTTYMYKFSIILMSHIGRSLFFGRALLGWLAVLIPNHSDNCQVSVLCTKGVWIFLCWTPLGMTFFILSGYWCDVCEVLGDHPTHYLCNCRDPIEE